MEFLEETLQWSINCYSLWEKNVTKKFLYQCKKKPLASVASKSFFSSKAQSLEAPLRRPNSSKGRPPRKAFVGRDPSAFHCESE